MDWQIRIAILIAGLILVGYIYWDFAKKKKLQQANEKLKRQFGKLSNQIDGSGFDLDGVGQARVAAEPNSDTVAGETIDQFIQSSQQETTVTENERAIFKETKTNSKDTQKSESKPLSSPRESKDFFAGDAVESEPAQSASQQQPELVFSLILQAKAGSQYAGKDFLPIFLSQGLRHGEMGIFHRYQKQTNVSAKGPGPVLFSLANAIAPGTFNIDNLDSFQTPALTLFMTLPCPSDAQIAYSAMVKTARLIVTELGGSVLDESQSTYSEQTHNHRLDQIQEHYRKSMS